MASGEPWTMSTSTPSMSLRRVAGSVVIQSAKAREVAASVWSYMTCAKWLSRSEV